MEHLSNKNKLIFLVILITLLIITILILVLKQDTKKEELVCTKKEELVSGFKVNEKVIFNLEDDIIKNIKLDKSITLSDIYNNDNIRTKVKSHFESSYNYIDIDDIKTNYEENVSNVKIDINKGKIIIDNLEVEQGKKNNKELRIISKTNSKDKEYKIDSKYTKENLKTNIESFGFNCK